MNREVGIVKNTDTKDRKCERQQWARVNVMDLARGLLPSGADQTSKQGVGAQRITGFGCHATSSVAHFALKTTKQRGWGLVRSSKLVRKVFLVTAQREVHYLSDCHGECNVFNKGISLYLLYMEYSSQNDRQYNEINSRATYQEIRRILRVKSPKKLSRKYTLRRATTYIANLP